MPRSYRVTRTIGAPASRVWGLLTDAARYPEWNPTVLRVDGRIADGASIELVAAIDPKRTFGLDVVVSEAPNESSRRGRMTWSDGMPLGLFRGVRTFTVDDGGSSTSFSMDETFSGPLAPLVTRFIPDLTDSFTQFADGLKSAAEA